VNQVPTAKTSPAAHGRPALGLAAILVAAGLLVVAFTGAYKLLSSPDRETVRAVFARTARLKAGDPVRIGGVEVGNVDRIGGESATGRVTVVMEVDRSAGPLYADAGATIKWRTLLGGPFVVELDRGTRSTGALGMAAIPERNTSTQVELEDFIGFDRGRAKTGLQTMPGELARALRDPHAFAGLFATLDDVAPSVARGMAATRGQYPDRDLQTL